MEDTDQPAACFEDTMNEAGIGMATATQSFIIREVISSIVNMVPKEAKDDYEALSEALL